MSAGGERIPPGATIGVLGDGQLGRMLILAAARLGFQAHVLAPAPATGALGPAAQVAARFVPAAYQDETTVRRFAQACAVVTCEFENVPAAALAAAAEQTPTRPGVRALETAQDRLIEKDFLREIGLATVPYRAIDRADQIGPALLALGGDAILKTRRFGYDGRGQRPIRDLAQAEDAFAAIGRAPAILEARAPFVRELSVIAARGVDGGFRAYEPAENTHEDGVLRRSQCPGAISAPTAGVAQTAAKMILDALDYVGVMGVEFFELEGGGLVVNEFAPRVHNSGHWTIEACAVDQFEQHIRAIAGWPLGDATRLRAVEMVNLLGDEASDWAVHAAKPGSFLHLYGKSAARPGRKMGHVTRFL